MHKNASMQKNGKQKWQAQIDNHSKINIKMYKSFLFCVNFEIVRYLDRKAAL